MNWGRLWIGTRDRLLALALMAAVIGSLAVASGGSVRFGEPASYDPPTYKGAVTAWSNGTAGLGGWLTNQTDRDCPSVVVWVQADVMDDLVILGPVAESNGFVALGVVHAHQRVIWAGYRHDAQGRIAPLKAAPRPDPSFICYR